MTMAVGETSFSGEPAIGACQAWVLGQLFEMVH